MTKLLRVEPLLVGLLVLCGCDDSRAVPVADARVDVDVRISRDGPWTPDQAWPDRGLPDLRWPDLVPRDVVPASDLDPCYCPAGQVWLRSSCVATTKLGCGPGCDPSTPNSCPSGWTCDQWAAAPCCMCSAAVPACVPTSTTGPISGPLRISPTDGIAGQSVTLMIEGAPFYIGALFYMIRMGNEEVMDMSSAQPCSVTATFTPPSPGIYAVEVSQYGGGTPWVLAGFYTASGGSIPMPTVQPGYPCAANPAPGDPACAQAAPYSCACVSGRCQCQ